MENNKEILHESDWLKLQLVEKDILLHEARLAHAKTSCETFKRELMRVYNLTPQDKLSPVGEIIRAPKPQSKNKNIIAEIPMEQPVEVKSEDKLA